MRSSTTRSGREALAELDARRAVGGDLDLEALAAQPGGDGVRDRGSSSTTRIVRVSIGEGTRHRCVQD